MGNDYKYQRNRGLKRKLNLIDLKGGCCELCGYNKNIASLEFHHLDPSKKDHQLDMRKLSNSTMVKLLEEVETFGIKDEQFYKLFRFEPIYTIN